MSLPVHKQKTGASAGEYQHTSMDFGLNCTDTFQQTWFKVFFFIFFFPYIKHDLCCFQTIIQFTDYFFFFLEQESFNVYIMEMFHSSAVDDITIIPKINFLYLKEKIRTNEFTACMPLGKSGNKKYIA